MVVNIGGRGSKIEGGHCKATRFSLPLVHRFFGLDAVESGVALQLKYPLVPVATHRIDHPPVHPS